MRVSHWLPLIRGRWGKGHSAITPVLKNEDKHSSFSDKKTKKKKTKQNKKNRISCNELGVNYYPFLALNKNKPSLKRDCQVSLSRFDETREPPSASERRLKTHTCRLTSQTARCVRMRTAISLLFCTARCNGEALSSLSCTFGSKPLFNKSFIASPVLSLIDN